MKTKQLFITVACLGCFALIGQAQATEQAGMQAGRQGWLEGLFRQAWDGQGADFMTLMAFADPTFRTALGISEEQSQQYTALVTEGINTPEHLAIHQQMDSIGYNPVDEDAQQRLQDLSVIAASLTSIAQADAADNTLLPEQKRKMEELRLANIAEMPFLSPSMFKPLDLTDAQKQQMEQIRNELRPEFEETLKNWVRGTVILESKTANEFKKEGKKPVGNPEEWKAVTKKLMENDPEYKKIYEEINSKGKAFATELKIKMFDVLTDEQWERMLNLIDNPPEHAKIIRNRLKELSGESEKAEAWQPGPNSWRPGDPIPIQYRQERNERGRFPRGE